MRTDMLLACSVVIFPFFVALAAPGQAQPPVTISVVPKESSAKDGGRLQFTVKIANEQQRAVSITTGNREPPFALRIIDQNGIDINRYANRPMPKGGGSTTSLVLKFAPQETKSYPVSYRRYEDETGATHAIPPGKYRVCAMLPITRRDGMYRATLLKSEPVEVTLKE